MHYVVNCLVYISELYDSGSVAKSSQLEYEDPGKMLLASIQQEELDYDEIPYSINNAAYEVQENFSNVDSSTQPFYFTLEPTTTGIDIRVSINVHLYMPNFL